MNLLKLMCCLLLGTCSHASSNSLFWQDIETKNFAKSESSATAVYAASSAVTLHSVYDSHSPEAFLPMAGEQASPSEITSDTVLGQAIYGEFKKVRVFVPPHRSPKAVPGDRRLSQAAKLGRLDVVEALIRSGYDWGTPLPQVGEQAETSEFWRAISSSDSSDKPPRCRMAGIPLARWIKVYIQAGYFPSADETVRNLLICEEYSLAIRVLRAASWKKPLDRQTTQPSTTRYELVHALIFVDYAHWARAVFDTLPRPIGKDAEMSLERALLESCNPELIVWFEQRGVSAGLGCFFNSRATPKAQQRFLLWRERSGRLSYEDFESKPGVWGLLDAPSAAWMRYTATYERLLAQHKLNSGRLGISFELIPGQGPVVVEVMPNSAAAHTDLQAGDQIESANGTNLVGLDEAAVLRLLRGPPGTVVKLLIKRADSSLFVKVIRQQPIAVQGSEGR